MSTPIPSDWRNRSRRAEARLAALDVALAAVARELDLDRVLQLIVDQVRNLSGARYAALGLPGAEGRIETFITSGMSPATRRRIGEPPAGRGLLGALIREGRSIRLADVGADARSVGVPPSHFAVRSFLGVPVVVRGRVVGNLYLANKRAGTFTTEDQDLVERFALHAGIAIDNARLLTQVQRLAVVEERERIGRELHDSVIQRLYGLSLSLEDVPDLVSEEPAEARLRVDRGIDALHAAIGEIRVFIYGLRPTLAADGDLRRSLIELADEIGRASDTPIDVEAAEVHLADDVASEMVAIAREALSNVARHAAATRARVELNLRGEKVRLVIADDGRGFVARGRRMRDHHGLSNIRDRASALGGRVRVRSEPGVGTRIIVEIPLDAGYPPGES
jgi:signal transduction histidine kinase